MQNDAGLNVKKPSSRARRHSPTVCFWKSHLNSLNLSFVLGGMVPQPTGWCGDRIRTRILEALWTLQTFYKYRIDFRAFSLPTCHKSFFLWSPIHKNVAYPKICLPFWCVLTDITQTEKVPTAWFHSCDLLEKATLQGWRALYQWSPGPWGRGSSWPQRGCTGEYLRWKNRYVWYRGGGIKDIMHLSKTHNTLQDKK